MSNAAFPVSELAVVIRESLSDGLALALRDGISGKLFSHILDPQGSGREAFHAAVFKWAASDLPQRLDEKRLFSTFALLFLDGLKALRRFFPDASPVRQTLADAEAFRNYIFLSANSLPRHRTALANYDKRLQADYAAMREWFSCHSLVGEALRHLGNLCKKLIEKGARTKSVDWRKDDPAVLKRRDDTKRVLAEINRRHKTESRSYPQIIRSMMHDPVWGARMRHRDATSWRSEAIKHKSLKGPLPTIS